MKLWRPSPLGPRKRAPAIETASTKNCGTRLLAALHIPPRATEAPVVAAASETPASGVACGGAALPSIGNRPLGAVSRHRDLVRGDHGGEGRNVAGRHGLGRRGEQASHLVESSTISTRDWRNIACAARGTLHVPTRRPRSRRWRRYRRSLRPCLGTRIAPRA